MFSHNDNGKNHGIRRAATAQALAWWQRLGASHEATDTLYRVMCLAPYPPGGMAVAYASNFVTFYYIINKRGAIILINTLSINRFH
jgi:hypothetical protein